MADGARFSEKPNSVTMSSEEQTIDAPTAPEPAQEEQGGEAAPTNEYDAQTFPQPEAPAEPAEATPAPAKPAAGTPSKKRNSVQVSGEPGHVKVTVDQAGRVGMWASKPQSILHMHSDEPERAAKVTVTGSTAGFAFGSRAPGADAAELFELYADADGAVLSKSGAKLAIFGADGTTRLLGKVHAESFESTSSRAFKSRIEPFPAAQAHKVRGRPRAGRRALLSSRAPSAARAHPSSASLAVGPASLPSARTRACLPSAQVLDGLDAVRYEFARTGEKHVGFIAEDVPDEVANAEHTSVKVLDLVSVLACVVKEQRETIARLAERVELLEAAGR